MKDKDFTIRIDSILGGMSAFENFGQENQFQNSVGIDPDAVVGSYGPSGYIIPSAISSVSSFSNPTAWMETEPKIGSNIFVYDIGGSVYTTDGSTITGLTDLNDGGTSHGNGFAYYDNYIYAARDTTVARYGPLNGSPSWTDDYWVSTLSKTALTNTTYPTIRSLNNHKLPNHVMLRHSDGALYFADVVGNQGVLHKIQTTNTSGVEGDTDNGSTYNAIDFPFGMYVTAIASYGNILAVALYEGTSNPTSRPKRAKLSFWDTTNTNTYDLITSVEFPDTVITAMINSNGTLYVFSGEASSNRTGTRITRFVGGYSFEQVAYLDYAVPPIPGGVESALNKILFGSNTGQQSSGAVYSIGSKLSPISTSIFNIIGGTSTQSMGEVGPIKFGLEGTFASKSLIMGAYGSGNPLSHLWNQQNQSIGATSFISSKFISATFRIGGKFKIKKVKLDLTNDITALNGFTVIPKLLFDNNRSSKTLVTISTTLYSTGNRFVIEPENATGNFDFNLQLDFGGSPGAESSLMGVALPITIEGEYLDD